MSELSDPIIAKHSLSITASFLPTQAASKAELASIGFKLRGFTSEFAISKFIVRL